MAVVRAPALSLDASGNLGSICYSSWRGLNVARDTWTGTDPNTGLQQAMRVIMKTVVQAWGATLNGSERESWTAAALSERRISRVKTYYTPTGYQFYVQLNFQRLRLGGALMKIPPAAIDPYTWMTFRLGYNYYAEKVNLHFEDTLGADDTEFSAEICMAGPYDSGGRHAIDGEYRFLRFIQPIGNSAVSGLTIGKYYWFRARVIDDYGRTQGWFEKQILIPTKASGQLILNSEFTKWTADDPDDWKIENETADSYITEDTGGALAVNVVGEFLIIKSYFTVEHGKLYMIEIKSTVITNPFHLNVRSYGHYYVDTATIIDPLFEREFTGLTGFLDVEFYIRTGGLALQQIFESCKVYKID